MCERFAGRTAVVTGASRGIGLAIAEAIVAGGGNVVITARRPEQLDEALRALGAPDRTQAIPGRTDDEEHQQTAIDEALARFGTLDILVNNAATNPVFGPAIDAEPAAVRKIFDVNVVAPLAWVGKAWNASMRDHGGVVLNVASVGGVQVNRGLGPYGASKAALVHLTRQLAVELSPGVRVNAIAPAVVKTRFAEALYADGEQALADVYPARRLGLPEDAAGLAAFLLSDEAAWITGQTVVLDGGVTLVAAADGQAAAAQRT